VQCLELRLPLDEQLSLIRFETSCGATRIGICNGSGEVRELPLTSMAEALRLTAAELKSLTQAQTQDAVDDVGRVLPPVDGRTEVWASGVTYLRSRTARREESRVPDVYAMVYEAERPELFFKAVSWKVVGDGDPIGIRVDSAVNVPEPELAAVANAHGEIVGYTICNDVSSRSIEGENPLYLPQAKVYAGACSLGPAIRLFHTLPADWNATIGCTIQRAGALLWSAMTNTDQLVRSPAELMSWLFRQDHYPDGAVLSTGTGLVPELDVALQEGDTVEVLIEGIGRLRNHVRVGTNAFGAQKVSAQTE
jgi:2-dehydro-3-deoxy-D-arabinonate dehydratase